MTLYKAALSGRRIVSPPLICCQIALIGVEADRGASCSMPNRLYCLYRLTRGASRPCPSLLVPWTGEAAGASGQAKWA